MKRFILPALLVALWTSAVTTADEKPDLKKQLAGTWEMKSLLIGGKKQNPDPVTWMFENDVVVVREGDKETTRWGFSVTADKSPPRIDFTTTRGGTSELLLLGVVKLDGDELMVAMLPALTTKDGTPVFIRPEAVESTQQNRAILATFKRKK